MPQGPTSGRRASIEPYAAQHARSQGHRWLWLVAGIAWIVVSLVILQFDSASVTTVGILVGLMFMFASVENFALLYMPESRSLAFIEVARFRRGLNVPSDG
jgi:hypothetical protein